MSAEPYFDGKVHGRMLDSDNNVAPVADGTDQKSIFHLHHRIGHVLSQPGPFALLEEQRCSESKLHSSEMNAQARTRSGTKGREGCFLIF